MSLAESQARALVVLMALVLLITSCGESETSPNGEDSAAVGADVLDVADSADVVTSDEVATIDADGTETPYRVRITPKGHADMPAPPGAAEAVTGTAEFGDGERFTRANAAIRAKYGWQVPVIGALYAIARLFGRGHTTDTGVVITLD